MDTIGALIALLSPVLTGWNVTVPQPAGVVAADTPPESFPPSVIVEQHGGTDELSMPGSSVRYRLRFMAPSSVAAMAAIGQARAIGRNSTTGMSKPGYSVPGYGFLRSISFQPPIGPMYDPDTGTPTLLLHATAVWYDIGG